MALQRFIPTSPDVNIRSGQDLEGARFGHLNTIVEYINDNSAKPAGLNGYVQFNNNSALGADSDLFWDNTNKYLGIGNTTPAYQLSLSKQLYTQKGAYLAIDGGTTSGVGNYVGIGTTNPQAILHILYNYGQVVRNERIGDNTSGPTYRLVKGRGVIGAPTPNLINDSLGDLNWQGYSAAGTVAFASRIISTTTEPWSLTNRGARLDFITNQTGTTTAVNIMNAFGTGVNIGNGTADLGARLGIKGSGSTAATISLLLQNSSGTQLGYIDDLGQWQIGTGTNGGYKLDVNGTARVLGELTVFKPVIGTDKVATFYGYQAPNQAEAFIEVGMQSTDGAVAILGGSNTGATYGGFLQTKNGSRAFCFRANGTTSIATQIQPTDYTALSIGMVTGSVGNLPPNTIGTQLAVLPRTLTWQGSGTLQPKVAFNSFGISSVATTLSATTYTDAINVYIDGVPTQGNNVTFNNRYALYVNAGNSYFGGSISIKGSGSTSATMSLRVQNSSSTDNFFVRDDGYVSISQSIVAKNWSPGGTAVTIQGGPWNGTIGLLVNSTACPIVAASSLGADVSNPNGASIYAAGGASATPGMKSIGILSNRAIISSGNAYVMDDSAMLEVLSTTQGLLFPRMTSTQKNAIVAPAAGLAVYDTTLNKLCIRTAAAWETITSAL